MSTIQASNLKNAASASNNIVLDASGNATFAGTAAMASSFLRNRIINGGMEIAQRGTTATGTYSSAFVYPSVDRWAIFSPNSSTTFSQSSSAPAGFRNSLVAQRPAGNTGTGVLFFSQGIEAANCYDLSGQTVTFSFWARRGANYSGGNLQAQLVTGTTADQGISLIDVWAGRAVPIGVTTPITSTWTRYTFTGTVGSGVLEAAVTFLWTPSGTAGADDSVYITGVQLEVGTAATPFERRQFGQELALCQRYYNTTSATIWGGQSFAGQYVTWSSYFPVTMRSTPTVSITSVTPFPAMNGGPTLANVFSGSITLISASFSALNTNGACAFVLSTSAEL